MTTIAWDGLNLAADSRMTRGDVILHGPREKIARSRKYYAGISGTCTTRADEFLEAVRSGKFDLRKPIWPDQENTVFLVISNRGVLTELYMDESRFSVQIDKHFAWGSGRSFAFGALAAGASAAKAVEIACKYDVYSGGDIVVL